MSNIQQINLNKYEIDHKLADTDDPIAQKVEWTPLKLGGASFKIQELSISPDKISTKFSFKAKKFFGGFIFGGCLSMFFGIYYWNVLQPLPLFFIFLHSLSFIGFPLKFFLDEKHLNIDLKQGIYYSAGIAANPNKLLPNEIGNINDFYAVQLLSETLPTNKGAFRSHELNIVLKNAQRINLMDHGDINNILESAEIISNSLKIPIWQASY